MRRITQDIEPFHPTFTTTRLKEAETGKHRITSRASLVVWQIEPFQPGAKDPGQIYRPEDVLLFL